MNGLMIFLGVAAGVVLAAFLGVQCLRRKLRRLGLPAELNAWTAELRAAQQAAESTPKSLRGMDALLLPRIRQDFPDFDVTQVKEAARQALTGHLQAHRDLVIHNVVLAEYRSTPVQKALLLQAAVAWGEGGTTVQSRYDLTLSYRPEGEDPSVAATCPNCGAPLAFGATVCSYCDSRITNPFRSSWRFTEIRAAGPPANAHGAGV